MGLRLREGVSIFPPHFLCIFIAAFFEFSCGTNCLPSTVFEKCLPISVIWTLLNKKHYFCHTVFRISAFEIYVLENFDLNYLLLIFKWFLFEKIYFYIYSIKSKNYIFHQKNSLFTSITICNGAPRWRPGRTPSLPVDGVVRGGHLHWDGEHLHLRTHPLHLLQLVSVSQQK